MVNDLVGCTFKNAQTGFSPFYWTVCLLHTALSIKFKYINSCMFGNKVTWSSLILYVICEAAFTSGLSVNSQQKLSTRFYQIHL